ncbi:hypothetical protein [Devosia sp.]|uniref:hypothetical protein n=1 Tax=Devosia sp. TaxID=1871048 RepID=UPI0019EBD484|nr:hypothetical protein [Devosia sp.]MBE0580819.1 hypothetical protein [Devosia sp.]
MKGNAMTKPAEPIKLSPAMAERRAEFAEVVVPMLEATKRRLDGGWPASEGERQQLDENLAWWLGEAE